MKKSKEKKRKWRTSGSEWQKENEKIGGEARRGQHLLTAYKQTGTEPRVKWAARAQRRGAEAHRSFTKSIKTRGSLLESVNHTCSSTVFNPRVCHLFVQLVSQSFSHQFHPGLSIPMSSFNSFSYPRVLSFILVVSHSSSYSCSYSYSYSCS